MGTASSNSQSMSRIWLLKSASREVQVMWPLQQHSLEQVLGSLPCLNTAADPRHWPRVQLCCLWGMCRVGTCGQIVTRWGFLKSVDFGGLWILANLILNSEFAYLLVFGKDVNIYLWCELLQHVEYYIIRNLTCQEKRLRELKGLTGGISWLSHNIWLSTEWEIKSVHPISVWFSTVRVVKRMKRNNCMSKERDFFNVF